MPRRGRGTFGPVIDDPRPSPAGGRSLIIGLKEDSAMTETFVDTMNVPGAVVPVDPRLEALLAINLLDDEVVSAPVAPEDLRHRQVTRATHERTLVLSR
jgi:hypothetical protein